MLERLYREIRARRSTRITRVVRHPYGKCQLHDDGTTGDTFLTAIRRCGRDTILEAFFQIQGRPVAIPAAAVCFEISVAPIYHHILPL